jgi:hypothetical protein
MMVVAAGREKRGLFSIASDQIKAHHFLIETDGPLQVGDLQMHMTNRSTSGDRGSGHRGKLSLRIEAGSMSLDVSSRVVFTKNYSVVLSSLQQDTRHHAGILTNDNVC